MPRVKPLSHTDPNYQQCQPRTSFLEFNRIFYSMKETRMATRREFTQTAVGATATLAGTSLSSSSE